MPEACPFLLLFLLYYFIIIFLTIYYYYYYYDYYLIISSLFLCNNLSFASFLTCKEVVLKRWGYSQDKGPVVVRTLTDIIVLFSLLSQAAQYKVNFFEMLFDDNEQGQGYYNIRREADEGKRSERILITKKQ
jgi:hypothetical protein